MIPTGEADSPGAENTEAVQIAHAEGATHDPNSQTVSRATGYADAYEMYLELGWPGVLPLKSGTKYPPPSGYTGNGKPDPTADQMAAWAQGTSYCDGNLCLRLPDGVVGIDVDAYNGKTAAETLTEAEKRWGALPPTVRSTSRDDGVSGIRLYRVPPGTVFPGGIKFPDKGIGDVDIVQHHHRYMVCAPSIHPEGRPYLWFDEDTGEQVTLPPPPGELTELPHAWLEGLQAGPPRSEAEHRREAATTAQRADGPRYDVTEAMTAGVPSEKVATRLEKALHDLQQGTNRHDTMLGHVLALLRLGQSGQPGVNLALRTLYRAFVDSVGEDRQYGEVEAGNEFARMITNADRLLADPEAAVEAEAEDAARAEAAFWAQRPILTHIRQFASVRRASPYAALGAVLRRAITLIPPSVQLPPTVGANASVNLYTASVGRSGQGKDIANGVGASAVRFVNPDRSPFDDPPSPGIGSGEGLARYFRGQGNGDELVQVAANVEVNEVGTVAALADRKGGTLVGELLKAFTGQALGFTNAQRSTTTHIPAHSYRLCMGISAQPENADFFLKREKDGLPQRFLWLPSTDPFARPPGGEPPEELTPAEVVIPAFFSVITGVPLLIGVPQSIRSEIEEFRYLVLKGSDEVDPLDGHLMLLKLKVAFGLAVLDERRDINEEDWRIGGQLIEVSNRVRAEMKAVVRDRSRRANSARAHEQAERQTIIDDRLTETRQQRVAGAIKRKLDRVGQATRRELLKACTLALREEFEPVLDAMIDNGEIVLSAGGEKYELAAR